MRERDGRVSAESILIAIKTKPGFNFLDNLGEKVASDLWFLLLQGNDIKSHLEKGLILMKWKTSYCF